MHMWPSPLWWFFAIQCCYVLFVIKICYQKYKVSNFCYMTQRRAKAYDVRTWAVKYHGILLDLASGAICGSF